MDRRSFITALIGGMAAASVGGIAMAQAAQPQALPLPAGVDEALPAATAEALDGEETGFSQYRYRRRHWRRPYHRNRWRHRRRDRRSRPRSGR